MSATPEPSGPGPDRIGEYQILQKLASGGMGTVYVAKHEAIDRLVALKVVKLGMDCEEIVERFRAEREALAMMSHDGIAKVYDCGTTQRGQPFFVMEFVNGVELTKYCDSRAVPLHGRIDLVQQLCAAVQHAHQKSVVHRDLKPGNVLVADGSGAPRVKVIDFGIAKALGPKLTDGTLFTEFGRPLGTPEYMAPEQVAPDPSGVDTRADVYAIGVVLYELLVGSLPFPSHELRDDSGRLEFGRLVHLLRDVDPPRPSTRLIGASAAVVADKRRTSLPALRRSLQNDLDWVVMKALEKDRNRRYATPIALAEDLQRFLDQEPLIAKPPSPAYRLRKFVRRHRGRVAAASAVGTTIVVAAIVATVLAVSRAAALRDFDQLVTFADHERLLEADGQLHPAWPESAAALEQWLDDATALVRKRESVEAFVREQAHLAELPPDDSHRSLHATMAKLPARLDRLAAEVRPGVERRLRWARGLAALERDPGHAARWRNAFEELAGSARHRASPYAGEDLALRPADVAGLVPLGFDRRTGLFECYDLRSAWDGDADVRAIRPPSRDANGGYDVRDDTGIVFVLVPGGTFAMGAPETEAMASDDTWPVRTVALEPFWLARHELTRGQWDRIAAPIDFWWREGHDYGDGPIGRRHPATQMTWAQAENALARSGMCLPTEAQWEYACRAATRTPWSCAADDLERAANLAGGADGVLQLAPVGGREPNAFGLHDVHGNVAELCRDWYVAYEHAPRAGDGLRELPEGASDRLRVSRGGSLGVPAAAATSFVRTVHDTDAREPFVGVRAARSLRRR